MTMKDKQATSIIYEDYYESSISNAETSIDVVRRVIGLPVRPDNKTKSELNVNVKKHYVFVKK